MYQNAPLTYKFSIRNFEFLVAQIGTIKTPKLVLALSVLLLYITPVESTYIQLFTA